MRGDITCKRQEFYHFISFFTTSVRFGGGMAEQKFYVLIGENKEYAAGQKWTKHQDQHTIRFASRHR